MKNVSRLINIPVLIVGLILSTVITGVSGMNDRETTRKKVEYLAESKLSAVEVTIDDYTYLTESLGLVLQETRGSINDFDTLAESIFQNKTAINSIQLAPQGVVEYIYPEKGNEAGKINLFEEPDRRDEAIRARDTGETIIAGPFELRQGGIGIVARKPVYIIDESGEKTFWGFSIVVLNVDTILKEAGVDVLDDLGYAYKLTVTDAENKTIEVDSYGNVSKDAIQVDLQINQKAWKLELIPLSGWTHYLSYLSVFLLCLAITFLAALTQGYIRMYRELTEKLQKDNYKLYEESTSDVLTGIYNRRGGDECMQNLLEKENITSGVLIALDIDNFKHLNDVYGHEAGDEALKQLAVDMKKTFGDNAVYIRNGGDEFMIFLIEQRVTQCKDRIRWLAEEKHRFYFQNKKISFGISCGYMEYPEQAYTYREMSRLADTALYNVKMNGKKGCAQYGDFMTGKKRFQLSFSLTDFLSGMPGAMMIYRADAKEEILFANDGMVKLFDCKNLDEFLEYTNASFKKVVSPQDYERVEQEIWDQIEKNTEELSDYVEYNIITAKGVQKEVEDYGHLVRSKKDGDIFYVILNEKQKK